MEVEKDFSVILIQLEALLIRMNKVFGPIKD